MLSNKKVWVLDDDPGIRYVLQEYLQSQGMQVSIFSEGPDLLDSFESASTDHCPDLVMADIRLDGENGLDVMKVLREKQPNLPVIVMTAYSDLKTAVGAFQGGAFEFLAKPFDLDEVGRLVEKAMLNGDEAPVSDDDAIGLIGQSSAFQELIRMLGRLSKTDIPVLITGETGSGKELVARALHQHSPRANGPFVGINMAAIPDDLLESELFGHERGAFTGADEKRIGRFEQAANGTLFLDEIGDMPLRLQTRLLRVLAEGEYYRLGGRDLIKAKARIITATNQNLETQVREGRFRADLYHRLKVIALSVPALRQRRDDIPQLIHHFLDLAADEFHVPKKKPDPALVQHLSRLDWPGNVRELKNLCQSLAVLAPAPVIQMDDLPSEYRASPLPADPPEGSPDWLLGLKRALESDREASEVFERYKARFEKTLAETVVNACDGNQSKAARRLGISRNTLARFLNNTDIS